MYRDQEYLGGKYKSERRKMKEKAQGIRLLMMKRGT